MLEFLKINIVGFCSIYEETELELNSSQITLIKAPNGSGKSTIFSALSWVLYGKTLKGESKVNTWKKFQDSSYKGTKVELFFKKDDQVYKITRCQGYRNNLDDGAKGNDRLLVQKEAELVSIKGKVNIQSYLVSVLGLSYKLFINSIMFGEDVQRLISESSADKKKIFEEAFNLDFLNKAKDLASEEHHQVEEEYLDSQRSLQASEREYKLNKSTYLDLKNTENSFKDDLKKEKKSLINERSRLSKELSELNKDIKEDNFRILQKKLYTHENKLNSIKEDLRKAREISNTPLLDVINKLIKLLEKGNSEKALKKAKLIKKSFKVIESLTTKKDRCQEQLRKLELRKRDLQLLKKRSDDLAYKISKVDTAISNLLNKKTLKRTSPKYKAKYLKSLNEVKALKKALAVIEKKKENYDWLLRDPLSNRGIKSFLFDSCLEDLNATLDNYSSTLGFRISFEVDLDSTKKDFITLIEKDGCISAYEELSRGEKQLCDVAMAFAMNESLSSSKNINLALLDEVFEHLDDNNIELVISLIKQVYEGRSLFIITHQKSLPLSNVKNLQVIKAQGHSILKRL